MELREQIAKALYLQQPFIKAYLPTEIETWEEQPKITKNGFLALVDSIPELKEVLEVYGKYKQGKLVEKVNHVPQMIPRKDGDMRPVDNNGLFI